MPVGAQAQVCKASADNAQGCIHVQGESMTSKAYMSKSYTSKDIIGYSSRSRLFGPCYYRTLLRYDDIIASMTAWVTCSVFALPPKSFVITPLAHVFSTAFINRAAASCSPSQSNISHAVQNVPTGLAIPMPVISKAEPWIGSNIDGIVLEGSMLAVGAIPMDPARADGQRDQSPLFANQWCNGGRLTCSKIRENVGVQVGSQNGVETFGM